MERTEKIEKSFKYAPKNTIASRMPSLLLGMILVIVPTIHPFGIYIRNIQIISLKALTAISVVVGLAIAGITIAKIMKANMLMRNNARITVDGDKVTYPVISNGKVEYESFNISDIKRIDYNKGDKRCDVRLSEQYAVFDVGYFESKKQFDDFFELINVNGK